MKTQTDRKALPERPGGGARLEHKSFECEVKAEGDDGSFELYALAFGNEDRQGDIIAPGAVKNLEELVRDGWGALNHRAMELPVAYAESATQDARGLLIRGKFHSHPEAQACRTVVRERIKAGKRVLCSIGYAVDDAAMEVRDGEPVRILKAIRVYEFSFVNLPANPEAGVVSAKRLEGGGQVPELDETEKGFIASLKKALGLDTKKGRMISAANHQALCGHADAMEKCMKDMKACHKAMADAHGAFKAFLDGHAPDDDGDEEEEESPPKKPKKKDAEPEDTAEGDPPKGKSVDRASIGLKLAGLPRPH